METTFIPISRLDETGLENLADLHCAVMHTLLADLGRPVVLRYYQQAQKYPSFLGLCAATGDGRIAGWAAGSNNPAELNALLRKPLAWFAGQMLRLGFSRPRVLVDLIGSLFSAAEANTLRPGQLELTYIGVAAHAQGQGLGRRLLAAFCQAAARQGYTSVALSVETDNPAAIGLYTGSGFMITKTFREGRYERHRMEKDLPVT